MNNTSYNEYFEILNSYIKKFRKILKNKDYADKKIDTNIVNSLSSVDLRVLFHPNYIKNGLELDDIQEFKQCVLRGITYPETYVPFEINFEYFFNFGSVLITVKDMVKKYLFNKYGYYNLVYVPIKQSLESDPYSFYYLKFIKNGKRYWDMDCRLEETGNRIINNLQPFLINIFRKIYFDIFKDNIFRKDYEKTNSITSNDLEQLLYNIFTLSTPITFCKILRDIVKENATYIPTGYDKFNFYGDDMLQKKKFQMKETFDPIEIVKLLFDDINSEEGVDFYRSKQAEYF